MNIPFFDLKRQYQTLKSEMTERAAQVMES